MNTNLRKLSLATALLLGLALTGAAHAASHTAPSKMAGQEKVIHLGTIKVTRANAEGARRTPAYGSTMILPAIEVGRADRSDRYGSTMVLRPIQVTPADTEEARYALDSAAAKTQSRTLGLGAVIKVIYALVFG